MANVTNGGGFKPVRHLNGMPWNGKARMYYTSDANALFLGDAVKSTGTADATGKYAAVTQATAGTAVRGVVVGFSNQPYISTDTTNLYRNYKAATDDLYVLVVDDPDVIFEVEEDNAGTDLTITEIGLSTNFVVGSGDTSSGRSAMKLDSSDTGTDTTGNCKLLNVSNREDNALGTYCKWDILFLEHELRSATDV
jgi:hypothetical protein